MEKQTAVEWLAEKYNYVTWMRNRDEISAGLADEWRKHYLEQAKQIEIQQAHEYAEFAIRCDKKEMKILNFDGFINLE